MVRSGRRMLTCALLGVAFVVSVTALQPVHADANPGSDFLAALNRYEIDLSALMGQAISPQDAIGLGQDICNGLQRGTPVAGEIDLLYREMPRITDRQAGNLVSSAQFTICPDTF
jgi:Protein of unknown function (DUF732)